MHLCQIAAYGFKFLNNILRGVYTAIPPEEGQPKGEVVLL